MLGAPSVRDHGGARPSLVPRRDVELTHTTSPPVWETSACTQATSPVRSSPDAASTVQTATNANPFDTFLNSTLDSFASGGAASLGLSSVADWLGSDTANRVADSMLGRLDVKVLHELYFSNCRQELYGWHARLVNGMIPETLPLYLLF